MCLINGVINRLQGMVCYTFKTSPFCQCRTINTTAAFYLASKPSPIWIVKAIVLDPHGFYFFGNHFYSVVNQQKGIPLVTIRKALRLPLNRNKAGDLVVFGFSVFTHPTAWVVLSVFHYNEVALHTRSTFQKTSRVSPSLFCHFLWSKITILLLVLVPPRQIGFCPHM